MDGGKYGLSVDASPDCASVDSYQNALSTDSAVCATADEAIRSDIAPAFPRHLNVLVNDSPTIQSFPDTTQ